MCDMRVISTGDRGSPFFASNLSGSIPVAAVVAFENHSHAAIGRLTELVAAFMGPNEACDP